MTSSDPVESSEPQWSTPYLKLSLQFLALAAPERQKNLPYTFDGRITLDNGYLVECDHPMHLMLLFLQEFTFLPEFWENDPEFTLLTLSGKDDMEKVGALIADLRTRLETLTWRELQTDASECQQRAVNILMLLAWPCTAPEVPAVELLDEYTYGGFSQVARLTD